VCRYEFVMGNVDKQIDNLESFDTNITSNGWDNFQSCRSDMSLGDDDSGMEVVASEILSKGTHLLDTNTLITVKFDPNGSNIGRRAVGVLGIGSHSAYKIRSWLGRVL